MVTATPSAKKLAKSKGLKLEDTLASSEPAAETCVEMTLLHGAIKRVFEDLDADEKHVVSLRFGLENGAPLAPAAVAAACGRSKDWVRRCEMRAIRKLRKPHHLMALRPYNAQREALLSGSHSA